MAARRSSEERRRQIADAAIKIIGAHGLRDFTMARLAAEVGIKDGSIFRHFKDKRDILRAVLARIEELLSAAAPPPLADPLLRLEEFLSRRMHTVAASPGLLSIIFADHLAHALGTEGRRRIADLRNRGRDFIRACLREAADQNLIAKETDVESAVLLASGMAMSLMFAVRDGAALGSIDEVGHRTWKYFVQLLRR